MMSRFFLLLLLALAAPALSRAEGPVVAAGDAARMASISEFEKTVAPFLARHCSDCHGLKLAEKELRFDKLEPDMKATASAARWAVVLTQLRSGKMPPDDKPKPAVDDVNRVAQWIEAEMKRSGKHVAQRAEFVNGNSIDHALLFDPKRVARFDEAPSVRTVSPEIYSSLATELGKGIPDIGQPFTAETRFTFKDMGAPKIDEPTAAQLMRNALLIVERRLTAHKIEGGVIKASQQSVPKQFLRLLDEVKTATDAEVAEAIKVMFQIALKREPSAEESKRFAEFYARNVKDSGRVAGTNYTLAGVLLLPEAIFRLSLGAGERDAKGRVRLAPREIAFAISFALTDRRPDQALLAAASSGELNSDEGVLKQVRRLLDDSKTEKPRIARFFREYFGYAKAGDVFKEDKDNPEHEARVLIEDTDRLIAYVLEQDKNVFRELLTTNKTFVAYKSGAETKKRRKDELKKFEEQKAKEPQKFATKKPPKVGRSVYEAYGLTNFPDTQPVELPASERAGILTQPAWLVAHSTSFDNHVIHRGKWIRERLLGGVVPDIPITVDAQLPIAPEKTLRERLSVTKQEYCWQCHRLMNDLALPFEQYDHFGRRRELEMVLDPEATEKNVDKKGKSLGPVMRGAPLDTSGLVAFVGDSSLEGKVENPVALMKRLAASERVEQVFIRHVFRYWMGRNETPGDAASLQAAQKAYRESGGSMKALIAAVLTSESFLYRVPSVEANGKSSESN